MKVGLVVNVDAKTVGTMPPTTFDLTANDEGGFHLDAHGCEAGRASVGVGQFDGATHVVWFDAKTFKPTVRSR